MESITVRHVVAIPFPRQSHINAMMGVCKSYSSKQGRGILITFVVTEEWLSYICGSDPSKLNDNRIMMGIHVPFNVPMESTPFNGMEFEADEIAYDFYNEYGRKAGFSIRKDKKNVVNEFIVEHDHYLHLPSTVHMMPSQRKVAATHAIEIDLAHESGLRLKQSYELLSKQVGRYDNLGFTKQDHKNNLRTKRQRDMEHGEAASLGRYFSRQLKENPSYYFATQLDCEELITNIF
ncbi:hypothetical protein SO802_013987 [Lithocarpus litseifolius]|uniref:Uncharacterized protein n=1 Tax=Lithocarpus litseifolius TaxID=425828 RepID=A0AAW2DCM8_9ROSI